MAVRQPSVNAGLRPPPLAAVSAYQQRDIRAMSAVTAMGPFMDALQYDLPLFDPLEPRILPQDAGAWFTINWLTDDGMKQRPYQLHLIEAVLRALGHGLDTYMSQFLCSAASARGAPCLADNGFVDLDTYKVEQWRGLPRDEMVRAARFPSTAPLPHARAVPRRSERRRCIAHPARGRQHARLPHHSQAAGGRSPI